jgi:hypothetical protein
MDLAFPMVIGIKNIKIPKRFKKINLAMVSGFLIFSVILALLN